MGTKVFAHPDTGCSEAKCLFLNGLKLQKIQIYIYKTHHVIIIKKLHHFDWYQLKVSILKVLIFQNLILKFFLLIIFCWINGELLFAPVCILCSIKRDHNKTTKKHTQKNSCNVQLNSYFIRTYGINFSSLR